MPYFKITRKLTGSANRCVTHGCRSLVAHTVQQRFVAIFRPRFRQKSALPPNYLLIQELSGIFLNVALIQVGGEAHQTHL